VRSKAQHEIGRRFRRSTVRIRVDYQTSTGLRSDTATTLGIGGLFISTRDPLPVGTIVCLRFRLAGGPQHEIDGRVVWCHGSDEPSERRTCGMGVEFARDRSTARLARELGLLASPAANGDSRNVG
jgi:uncharacterized protein (TIGR02266 family)